VDKTSDGGEADGGTPTVVADGGGRKGFACSEGLWMKNSEGFAVLQKTKERNEKQ